MHIAHPIFKIYRKNCARWCKSIIKDAIEMLLDHKLVNHNGPSTVITAINRQADHNRDILHVLHYITEKRSEDIYTIEDVIPLYNLEFKLYVGEKQVKAVKIVPELKSIDFTSTDGYIIFNVDKIEGHNMVSIEY
ncbi:hypothetical protein [Clostridium algidicarnis]|uniref:Uncharacterized protein n=1 Tax=Clostridium algidicarnis TaxID=37659 RepID=A0ABS6C1W3_9CLOT|nr:hypothetical protein [Clostridium algidicarnis]MBU3219467.1 hypothetical protein [Clostridium algidicarnis]MCB2287019.1 hypothetical protein [Clostridium algidicarnis]